MSRIYKKGLMTQSAGSLNLSGVRNVVKNASAPLEADAEKNFDLARETYLNTSKAASRNDMANIFTKNKDNPQELMRQFDTLKEEIGAGINNDQIRLEYLTDFEVAAAPYIRKAQGAFDTKQKNNFISSTKDTAIANFGEIKEMSVYAVPSVAANNPEGLDDLKFLIAQQDRSMNEMYDGNHVHSEGDRRKWDKYKEEGVYVDGFISHMSTLESDEQRLAYAREYLELDPVQAGVTKEVKDGINKMAKDIVNNPKITAEATRLKLGTEIELKNIMGSGEDKVTKINKAGSLIRNLNAGFVTGHIPSDDTKAIKLEKDIKTKQGEAIFSEGKSTQVSSRNVGEVGANAVYELLNANKYAEEQDAKLSEAQYKTLMATTELGEVDDLADTLYSTGRSPYAKIAGNPEAASDIYNGAIELLGEEYNPNDTSTESKAKMREAVKQSSKEYLKANTGAVNADTPPRLIMTKAGEIFDFDEDAGIDDKAQFIGVPKGGL